MAIINTVRMRNSSNAVFTVATALNLCVALMSIFVHAMAYRAMTKRVRRKLAPEIIRLSEEIERGL